MVNFTMRMVLGLLLADVKIYDTFSTKPEKSVDTRKGGSAHC